MHCIASVLNRIFRLFGATDLHIKLKGLTNQYEFSFGFNLYFKPMSSNNIIRLQEVIGYFFGNMF